MTDTIRSLTPVVWSQPLPQDTLRSFTPVVWAFSPGQGKIRQAPVHVLMPVPGKGLIRQVAAHVLMPNRKLPNAGGAQAILNLVNSEAKQVFTTSQISIGAPAASTAVPNTNTVIEVSALAGSGYSGEVNLYYSRINVANVFASTQFLLPAITSATTKSALIPAINTAYGTYLVPTDIVDGPVPAGTTSITLTIAAGSYVYIPGTQVTLMNTKALTSAITTTALNGFQNVRNNIVDPSLSGSVINVTALGGFANYAGVGPVVSRTVMLMHFDGTTPAAVATDTQGHPFTVHGVAGTHQTDTVKFGNGSYWGNASGAYFSTPDAPNLHLTNDLTIEFWLWFSVASGAVVSKGNAKVHYNTTSHQMEVIGDSGAVILAGTVPNATPWFAVAVVKKGNTWTMYSNGTAVATATSSDTFGVNTSQLVIGNDAATSFASEIVGYVDELRISGIARYTANYTPATTAFTPD
jgi:hypothetical protein